MDQLRRTLIPRPEKPVERFLHKILILFILFGTCLFFSPISANALKVKLLPDGRITLAADVPLRQVLERIAADGVDVQIDPAIRINVTGNFENQPIQQVMEHSRRVELCPDLGPYRFADDYRLIGIRIGSKEL